MRTREAEWKLLIGEKQAVLKDAERILKVEFVGIDHVIDEVLSSVSSWFLFPDLQEKPLIINMWGLILIGAGLIVGLFSRIASIAGIVLLAFYYLSHPAIIGVSFAMPTEGSYLWVNKNLIELLTLWVVMLFPTSKIIGMDRFLFNKK